MIGAFRSTCRAACRAAFVLLLPGSGLAPVFSQAIPIKVDSKNYVGAHTLLDQADSLLAARRFSEAAVLFRFALDYNDSLAGLKGLGRVALGQQSWSEAVGWFEEAVKHYPTDLEARYYLGCAHGERGRELYVLEHLFSFLPSTNFKQAEQDFRWVLSRDSLFEDALYQFALVYRYKREYPEAIALALKQIEMKPDLRNGHLGLLKIYREALGMHQGDSAPEHLTSPKNDYDRYFYADWLRRKGQLQDSKKVLEGLLGKPGMVRAPLIWQSLARIAAKQGNDEETQRCVAKSIDRIQTFGDVDLVFEDIKYIATDEELREYQSLMSVEEMRKFFAQFWAKRNPFPAQSKNTRIGEHYRRLNYAEDNFQHFGQKTYSRGSDETFMLRFPESYYLNEEFNDKGVIYIRHGEPDRKIVTLYDGRTTTFDTPGTIGGPTESNESWLYLGNRDFPEMLFDFYVPWHAQISDWRLVPVLSDSSYWPDRAVYSHKYSSLQYAPRDYLALSRGMAEGSRASALIKAIDEGVRTVSVGVTTDRHSFEKDTKHFESPISITCYRGTRGKTLVDLGYVVMVKEIAKEVPDSIQMLQIDATYSMYDPTWKRTASDHELRTYEQMADTGNGIIEIFHVSVPPDSYHVAWEARPVGENMIISQKKETLVPDFSGASLNMSDIELAYAIGPAQPGGEFNKGPLSVVPNPLRRCPINHPLHIYFETYNLTRDRNGKSTYTVEYGLSEDRSGKSLLARIFGGGKKTTINVRSERAGDQDWSREHIDIDMSDLEPGKYKLQVKVTDTPTKSTVSRSLEVEIYQPE